MTTQILIASWRYRTSHIAQASTQRTDRWNQILQGSLKETLYEWPDQNALDKGKKSPLRIKKETIYSENQVTYMCDKVD